MERIYSIGETAKIAGLSVQTLRKYSNMSLITPENIDKDSRYRYYSFNQLHLLDKIKYLRELGISLAMIRDVIHSSGNTNLESIMKKQHDLLEAQILRAEKAMEIVDWYLEYSSYPDKRRYLNCTYIQNFKKRYAICVCCESKEHLFASTETELMLLRHSENGAKLQYLRQFGYLLDYEELRQKTFRPKAEFMFIKEMKTGLSGDFMKNIITFPAGDYLCFFADKTISTTLDIGHLMEKAPQTALALEYSNNLFDYEENLGCEYQLYLAEGCGLLAAGD